jgi:hypothetical protein
MRDGKSSRLVTILTDSTATRQAICRSGRRNPFLLQPKRRLKERIGLRHGNLPVADKKSEAKGNKCVGGMCLRCHD